MAHDAPPSVVRITARNRLLAAHPFRPRKYRSEICPCSPCCWKLQLFPPSTLRRMKPPPPVIYTLSPDPTHTALTPRPPSPLRFPCAHPLPHRPRPSQVRAPPYLPAVPHHHDVPAPRRHVPQRLVTELRAAPRHAPAHRAIERSGVGDRDHVQRVA